MKSKSADEVIKMLVSERRFFVTLFHHFVHRYWTLKAKSRVDKADEEILGTIEKYQQIKTILDTLFKNINIFPSIFLDEALDALEKGDPSHLSVFFYFFPECIAPVQQTLEDPLYLLNRLSWERKFSNQLPNLTPLQNQSYLFQESSNQQFEHPLLLHVTENYQTALQRCLTLYNIIYSNSEDRVDILNMLNKKRESVSALEVNFGSLVNTHPAFDNFPELTRGVENLVLFYFLEILNLADNEGNTFLHTAVQLKNFTLIEDFFQSFPEIVCQIQKNNKKETFVDLLFDIGYFDSSFEEGEPLQTLEKFYTLFGFLSVDRQKNFSNLLFKTGEDFKTFMQIAGIQDNTYLHDKKGIIKIFNTLLKYYETLTTTDERTEETLRRQKQLCLNLCKKIINYKKYMVVLQLLAKHLCKAKTFNDFLSYITYFDLTLKEWKTFEFLSPDEQKKLRSLLFKTEEIFEIFMRVTGTTDEFYFQDKEFITMILNLLSQYHHTPTSTDESSSTTAKKQCIDLCKKIQNHKKYLVVLQLLGKHFPEECHDLKKTAIWASRQQAKTSEVTRSLIKLGFSNQQRLTTHSKIEDSNDNHNYALGCQIQRPETPPPSLPSPTY